MVGSVCNAADKVLQEAHKFYRLRTQQGPVGASTLKQAVLHCASHMVATGIFLSLTYFFMVLPAPDSVYCVS
jgi:hypothetical protein